ncbi:MAG: CHAD domain-containing protein [Chloroherpetonaceae bacterium]|nr:CHAD domain-containing protein [Chloroherpetonaceae bacterium]MDW8438323.1 CHAD domain-containing protein [Chloroherpetonaceae bacterium]
MARQDALELNSLAKHWQSAADAFEKNLLAIARRANHEAIHDARLAMKKLRSYATLYDDATGSAIRKTVEKFALLYRAAGACRDQYNALRLARKFAQKLECEFPLFDARLRFAMQSDLRYLRYALSACPVSTEDWRALKQAMPATKVSSARLKPIRRVIEERWESVEASDPPDDAETLHDLRKALKWILYCAQALPERDGSWQKLLKDIDELCSLLGKWQDLHQFERRAKTFKESLLRKSVGEYALLKRLVKVVKAEKAANHRAIARKFASLRKARAA